MRYFTIYIPILLAVVLSLSLGASLAQNNTTLIRPGEIGSQPVQLSGETGIKELAQVSGNASLFNATQINPGASKDVTRSANISNIFNRNPSVGVVIAAINPSQRWVEIRNDGIGPWNITGWSLSSGGAMTYKFPAIELADGASLRVREGLGNGTSAQIYTNATTPLWIGNDIVLVSEAGDMISSARVPA